MGNRVTGRVLAAAIATALGSNPATVVSSELISLGKDKSLAFLGQVTVGATVYDIASNNGKVKTFKNADDFVKFMASYVPSSSGEYDVKISTGTLLAPAIPSDLVAAKVKTIAALTAKKADQTAVSADLAAQIALMDGWESGNALQAARLVEVTAQKTAVDDDVDAIQAMIDDLA